MPSILTHPAVSLALGVAYGQHYVSGRLLLAGVGASILGSSGITRGFSIGWCEGTGKKTKEFLEWNPGWAKPG
jgi:hypothetical protein